MSTNCTKYVGCQKWPIYTGCPKSPALVLNGDNSSQEKNILTKIYFSVVEALSDFSPQYKFVERKCGVMGEIVLQKLGVKTVQKGREFRRFQQYLCTGSSDSDQVKCGLCPRRFDVFSLTARSRNFSIRDRYRGSNSVVRVENRKFPTGGRYIAMTPAPPEFEPHIVVSDEKLPTSLLEKCVPMRVATCHIYLIGIG